MEITRKSGWQLRVHNAVFFVLFATIIGLLAWLSREYHFQADWTAGNRNTLSESSRTLLASLAQPVEIIAFIPDNASLQQRIEARIQRFQRHKPDMRLSFVNPDLEPDRAQQLGIKSAGQVAIKMGGRTEIITALNEQSIVNALQRLTRTTTRWVLFLAGHGERDPFDERHQGLSQVAKALERSGLKAQVLNLVRTPAIPDNTAVLVIAGPQSAPLEGEIERLQQYVAAGGNLLWLQDPGHDSGLEPLAKMLGLEFLDGVVVDANPQLRVLLGIQHPAVVPVVDYGGHAITRQLKEQTLFPFASAIAAAGGDAWRVDKFLMTLSRTWAETGRLVGSEVTFNEGDGDRRGPLALGVSLSREPDGDPQRVVVVGDSDFLANGYLGHGDNLELALNLFNWLSEDEELISVVPRNAPDTRLVLSQSAMIAIAAGWLLVLPFGLLIAGLLIWYVRRRR